jgi:ABC-type glycerol-3-phosphate transport system substrate-binding protein
MTSTLELYFSGKKKGYNKMKVITLAWMKNEVFFTSYGSQKASASNAERLDGYLLYLILPFFLLVTSSCEAPQPAPVIIPSPLPSITAIGTPPAVVSAETLPVDDTARQLVIWAPAFFQPALDVRTNDALATVYEQFERSHPGVHIDVQLRADIGEASLLNYLRRAQRVAPTILPDIILIDAQQLWQVAELGMLSPIEQQQLGAGVEFYPFTVDALTSDDELAGVPYTTDLIHLVYDPEELPDAPRTWAEFLTSEQTLIFAAGKSENLNEFAYLQYLGAGGGIPTADSMNGDLLLAFFTFLAEARTLDLIPESVLEIATDNAAWDTFAVAEQSMAATSTYVILQHWDTINSGTVRYAPIPTQGGEALSVARVWAFAVVASDVGQQELSLTLIRAFLEPTVHSQWGRVAMHIPSQPAAFELWRNSSPYYEFVQTTLAVTQAFPYSRRFAELSRRLQAAQKLVLRNEMTPEEATLYVQTTP